MLFSVKTELNRKCWEEIYWFSLMSKEKWRQIILSLFLGIGVFLLSYSLIRLSNLFPSPYIPVIISAIIALMIACIEFVVSTPKMVAKNQIKMYERVYQKDAIHLTYCFYADYLEATCYEKQSTRKISYSKIASCKETKNYFILQESGINSLCVLDKAGFVAGTLDSFRHYIQSEIVSSRK